MAEITRTDTFDVGVDCEACGKKLETSASEDRYGDWTFTVTPCPDCLNERQNLGFDEGVASCDET